MLIYLIKTLKLLNEEHLSLLTMYGLPSLTSLPFIILLLSFNIVLTSAGNSVATSIASASKIMKKYLLNIIFSLSIYIFKGKNISNIT